MSASMVAEHWREEEEEGGEVRRRRGEGRRKEGKMKEKKEGGRKRKQGRTGTRKEHEGLGRKGGGGRGGGEGEEEEEEGGGRNGERGELTMSQCKKASHRLATADVGVGKAAVLLPCPSRRVRPWPLPQVWSQKPLPFRTTTG